jgi:HK97 family phage portal protein
VSLIARLMGGEYRQGAFARWASTLPERPAGASPQAMVDGSISMQEWADWFSSQRRGGEVSTPRAAMSIGAVYACVSLIAGAIASMPLKFYVRRDSGEREAYTPDTWWLFNEAWMPCWAAATAWEFTTQSLLLRGDWFARIHRQSPLSPRIIGIEPWHPDRVDVERRDERLRYALYPQDGLQPAGAKPLVLDQDDVLHVAGPGFDGRRGMSQIATVLRNTGAISLAADEHSAAFFRNSARPDYALATDRSLDAEQVERLRAQVAENHRGAGNAYRPMVLVNGLKVAPITMNAEDAQLIETRGFQVEDIARIFGVPPHMIGHSEKTTSWGSGVEQMGLGFVKYTLQRHLVKIEQEINRKVFRTARNFCEFMTAGLERGDIKTRSEAYRIAVGRAGEPGWLTVNEVRRAENLPPIDGGDQLSTAAAAAPSEAAE